MTTPDIKKLSVEGKTICLNPHGLIYSEVSFVEEVALKTIQGAKEEFPHALERCTFFVEHGYKPLLKALEGMEGMNPRIEGCDEHACDQHYWLAFNLTSGYRPILIDPIFGYVGLEKYAKDVVSSDVLSYYNRKRVVPNVSQWEGGVRIKTIGL